MSTLNNVQDNRRGMEVTEERDGGGTEETRRRRDQ